MKNPKKPDRRQKELMSKHKIDWTQFLVISDKDNKLTLYNKETKEQKILQY